MVIKAKVNIVNVNLGQVSSKNYKFQNANSICKNFYPTSAEVKCSVNSVLENFQTVQSINVPQGISFADTIAAEIDIRLNANYMLTVQDLSDKTIDRIIHLDLLGKWDLTGNSLDSQEFSSNKLDNTAKMGAIVPPSSCFNMTIVEKLSTQTISYQASARIALYDDQNNLITGSNNLASYGVSGTNKEISEQRITVEVTGDLVVNVVEYGENQLYPCK